MRLAETSYDVTLHIPLKSVIKAVNGKTDANLKELERMDKR
jgi:hypothetical protein